MQEFIFLDISMRFFLVRILGFTVVFTLILLLLSRIAPTWTGNTVKSLTARWPIQEESVVTDDSLIITDLSEGDEELEVSQNSEASEDEDSDDSQEEDTSTETIIIDKEESYNEEKVIEMMDEVLNIKQGDNTQNNDTHTKEYNELDEYKPTPPDPVSEEDEEVTHLPPDAELSPEEIKMLEQIEQSIR